jgi:hypothetical protein
VENWLWKSLWICRRTNGEWIKECKNDFVHSVLDWGKRNKYTCKSMKAKFNVGLLHRLEFIAAVNGIVGSSPAEGMDVLLLCMLCVV